MPGFIKKKAAVGFSPDSGSYSFLQINKLFADGANLVGTAKSRAMACCQHY